MYTYSVRMHMIFTNVCFAAGKSQVIEFIRMHKFFTHCMSLHAIQTNIYVNQNMEIAIAMCICYTTHHGKLACAPFCAYCLLLLHLSGLLLHSPSRRLGSVESVASHDSRSAAISLWSSIKRCHEIVGGKALRSAHYAEACLTVAPSV